MSHRERRVELAENLSNTDVVDVEASEMDPGLDDLNAELTNSSQAHCGKSSAIESGRAEGEPASSFYSRLKAEGVGEIDLEAVLGENRRPHHGIEF